VLVFVIGAVFWLALKGGQFDDLESPGLDVVLDDDKPRPSTPEAAGGFADKGGSAKPK
jgi:cbb3-type cytochrome oxidase maturation protein